jgi:multicomponent Na+:H+ antiporter subunit G
MTLILEIIGLIVMIFGLILMGIGIFGIFHFKGFYARILVVSKVDTVGTITFLFGLAIHQGISFFSGKILLIIIFILILSPLVGHMIARSAYVSDHKLQDPHEPEDSLPGDGL